MRLLAAMLVLLAIGARHSRAQPALPDAAPPLGPQAVTPPVSPPEPSAAADSVHIAPSKSGALGAWLVLGPFAAAAPALARTGSRATAVALPPRGFDERDVAPLLGKASGAARKPTPKEPLQPIVWSLLSAANGPVDLGKALAQVPANSIAYLAGTMHVASSGRYHLLVSADDGVELSVDGSVRLSRDESRPFRNVDDVLPLELAAGAHPIWIKLHQHDGDWQFQLRILNADLERTAGVTLELPGTHAADAQTLAAAMASSEVRRTFDSVGYQINASIAYNEGWPLGADLSVSVAFGSALRGRAGRVPSTGTLQLSLPGLEPAALEAGSSSLALSVAGRTFSWTVHPLADSRSAVLATDALLAKPEADLAHIPPHSRSSLTWLSKRLRRLVERGDESEEAQAREARELRELTALAASGVDPYATLRGPQRRAHVGFADGELSEFALYVPKSYVPGSPRKYPLVMMMHGMNGLVMPALRWFFGGDDPAQDQAWEDRHWDPRLPDLEAFVLVPGGYGNAMFRELGEQEPLDLLEWAKRTYPIDGARVTITGPSMGGIGTAALALHHPDLFAAAMPLCGYHSYFIRRDFAGKTLRPWEQFLAEERSNVEWARNGAELPMYIVHGTRDLPEENSGVLIGRYEKLGFVVHHEHPDLGHNVWQPTYEGLQGARWLMAQQARAQGDFRFRTTKPRFGRHGAFQVEAMARNLTWADVRVSRAGSALAVQASGVRELSIDRRALAGYTHLQVGSTRQEIPPAGATESRLALQFDEAGALSEMAEQVPPAEGAPLRKRGQVTGPFREVFGEPLLFVYGSADPRLVRANRDVAQHFAYVRYGTTVNYPVISDAEYIERGAAAFASKTLFLVGSASANRVLAQIADKLPIALHGNEIHVFGSVHRGEELGAAFVYPDPLRPGRLVAVVFGADAAGTYRATSLPDLLPDYVVYDRNVQSARGQMVLGRATVLDAGMFSIDWQQK